MRFSLLLMVYGPVTGLLARISCGSYDSGVSSPVDFGSFMPPTCREILKL